IGVLMRSAVATPRRARRGSPLSCWSRSRELTYRSNSFRSVFVGYPVARLLLGRCFLAGFHSHLHAGIAIFPRETSLKTFQRTDRLDKEFCRPPVSGLWACGSTRRKNVTNLNSSLCRRSAWVLLFVAVFLLPLKLAAQVDMGSISGTIKDASGAVIPNAKVTLTNDATGISASATTGAEGQYTFSPVKIGHYTISAAMAGFQTVEQKNVTVDVEQRVHVDITLPLGQSKDTIIVDAAPPILQTLDASVGQVIQEKSINDLPLNGRNFTFLAQLSAGVTQSQQDTRGLGGSGSFAANGLRPAQNN